MISPIPIEAMTVGSTCSSAVAMLDATSTCELTRDPVAADPDDQSQEDSIAIEHGPARADLEPRRVRAERQALVTILAHACDLDERRKRKQLSEVEGVLQRVEQAPPHLAAVDWAGVPNPDSGRVVRGRLHLGTDAPQLSDFPSAPGRSGLGEDEHTALDPRLQRLVRGLQSVELALPCRLVVQPGRQSCGQGCRDTRLGITLDDPCPPDPDRHLVEACAHERERRARDVPGCRGIVCGVGREQPVRDRL